MGSWNTGPTLPRGFRHFRQSMACFRLWGGGVGGGVKNVIHIACMPKKHWYLPRFRLFVQHTAQGCGTRHVLTRVHANFDDAQNTGIYRVFASLYDIPRNNAEQDTLSQASMPVATMPKTLVFSTFSPRCTTYCARMWKKKSCHKRPCLWLKYDLIFRAVFFNSKPATFGLEFRAV